MSAPEDDFRIQLATALEDLQENGPKDRQTIREIGALAVGLLNRAGSANWADLKLRLQPEALQSLLQTMKREGQGLLKAGHMRPALAMQTLSMSLVARTYQDPAIKDGEILLDRLIEGAIHLVRTEPASTAPRT
jgi:hypothetical protein